MKKRFVSMLLAAVMLFGNFSVCTFAANENTRKKASPYAVELSSTPDGKVLNLDDTVAIRINVSSKDSTVTQYSSYDISLSYDSKLLKLESYTVPDTDATVTDKNGVIRIKGYGEDKPFATSAANLVFRIMNEGEATVTIDEAKVDSSDNAGLQNAPSAAATNSPLVIKTSTFYTVKLKGDGLSADSLVASSTEDYFFTVENPKYIDYSIKVTVKGETKDTDISKKLVYNEKTATYKIPKEYIFGDINVVSIGTPKKFNVTITGKDVTGKNKATYMTDYTFTLKREKGYTYKITVKINNKKYTDFFEDEDAYTIYGEDIIGDIRINVTKEVDNANKVNVTFTGSGSRDTTGEATATKDTEYTFKVNAEKGYAYSIYVSIDGKRVDYDYDPEKKIYSIQKEKVTGDITISVTKNATLEITEYLTMGDESAYLILYRGTVGENQVPMYGESSMYWSDEYSAYAWLVSSSADAEEMKKIAEGKIALANGNPAAEVDHLGNVNMSLHADIEDARLILDIYNRKAGYLKEGLEMLKFFNADINGDQKINVMDAAALIYSIT